MRKFTSPSEMVRGAFVEFMKDVGTSIPAYVIAFNPENQTAQIQIAVVRIDINGKEYNLPPVIECPVYFAGGSGFFIEHEIQPNDECLAVFSQRCIDGWFTTGGIGQQPIVRFHDINDCCVFMGVRSEPNAIQGHENNGIRLRNKSGSDFVWMKNDGSIEIKSTANVNINGVIITPQGAVTIPQTLDVSQAVTMGASLDVTGAITGASVTAPAGTFGGIDSATHTHSLAGGGSTGAPNP